MTDCWTLFIVPKSNQLKLELLIVGIINTVYLPIFMLLRRDILQTTSLLLL